MADDDHSGKAGRQVQGDRLREAWRVLLGHRDDTRPGGSPAFAGRGAPHPYAAVIGQLIGGLPNPAIVLDSVTRVIAFNEAAAGIVPALRRDEPALIALRMPELAGDHADILVMTFHDLTPLRRVEEMRADFVANASHELRTPLAALLGFIETLQGPAKNDPVAREKFLGIMQGQAARMARLIDDLLSLSRIELNAHLQPSTPVDLAPLLRQVADGLQTLARDRQVEIKLTAPAEPLIVLGDRDELIRAIENLVENALKYGAAGKRVDITLTRAQTRVGRPEARIAVRDHGPGIAPEHLPRLTERFYRVDVADSRAQGGTGLGLALVKHVLNRHGGRLTIDSVLGQGATFTMHLPLRTGDAA